MDLANHIANALQELLDGGFELPIYVSTVSANGGMIFGRYTQVDDVLNAEILSEHAPGAFRLPINIMFVDAKGDAARVLIARPDRYQIVH